MQIGNAHYTQLILAAIDCVDANSRCVCVGRGGGRGGGGGTRERGLSREGSAHEFEGPFINAKIQAMIGPPGHE